MTPYASTSRRVALYRGVYPVQFEIAETDRDELYANIFETLLSNSLVGVDDLVIFTKGDLKGVSGSTNAMKILEVKSQG
jgi:pyruvate kinase